MKINLNLLDVSKDPVWSYSLVEIRLIANAVIKQISPRYEVAHVGRCVWEDSNYPSYIMQINGIGVINDDVDAVKRALAEKGFDTVLFFAIVNGYEVM